ncbi:MAG: hypothetical protein M3168_04215 [Actinomycetota bacterium]|nr:hypothetical protein [Actinomycetota bacterium]
MKLLLIAFAAFALAAPAQAGTGMYIGAAEDAGKSADIVVSKAKMDLAVLAGFDAIRLTAIWQPGQTDLEGYELVALENAAAAANLNGIRVVLSVYHRGSRTTPLTADARGEFAQFAAALATRLPTVRDFIVGNEPNLNMFWMPQFTRKGASASPAAYFRLLAATYDALKAVSPDITVIGGSVSPRGQDKHRSSRQTHSPSRFISELGKAYRASRRKRPIMDEFAFHPYGENSSVAPEFQRHPRSTSIGLSEYDRLVRLLGTAFDGTAQEGSTLPIVYDEYGVDTAIPAVKRDAYRGREPKTTRPISEARQSDYYRRALAMAYCQPTVKGFLVFHVSDEPDLDRWQSGLFYADDTPKASLEPVRRAVEAVRGRTIARCKPNHRWAKAVQAAKRKPAKPGNSRR